MFENAFTQTRRNATRVRPLCQLGPVVHYFACLICHTSWPNKFTTSLPGPYTYIRVRTQNFLLYQSAFFRSADLHSGANNWRGANSAACLWASIVEVMCGPYFHPSCHMRLYSERPLPAPINCSVLGNILLKICEAGNAWRSLPHSVYLEYSAKVCFVSYNAPRTSLKHRVNIFVHLEREVLWSALTDTISYSLQLILQMQKKNTT